jgi:hypothetical protein
VKEARGEDRDGYHGSQTGTLSVLCSVHRRRDLAVRRGQARAVDHLEFWLR